MSFTKERNHKELAALRDIQENHKRKQLVRHSQNARNSCLPFAYCYLVIVTTILYIIRVQVLVLLLALVELHICRYFIPIIVSYEVLILF